jgi:hypothetical protein
MLPIAFDKNKGRNRGEVAALVKAIELNLTGLNAELNFD